MKYIIEQRSADYKIKSPFWVLDYTGLDLEWHLKCRLSKFPGCTRVWAVPYQGKTKRLFGRRAESVVEDIHEYNMLRGAAKVITLRRKK